MKASQVGKQPVQHTHSVTCMICGTKALGYYGRWGDSGTCSRKCEQQAVAETSRCCRTPVTIDEE